LALAEVARGGLSGFVNITTNPWDTAAGEVLIKACGGRVTDFSGKEIDYSSSEKISIIAAKDNALHAAIMRIIQSA
jgi:fructose-1,6-bisphosphatase/inositol monophosphatase family enzyme